MEDQTINVTAFPFRIPLSTNTIKKLIIETIDKLSYETGMPGNKLPIYFYNSPPEEPDSTIAYFSYKDKGTFVEPISFSFNLYKFRKIENISCSQIVDIVKHEFAHYVRDVTYGPTKDDGHDDKYREVCKKLDCSPEPQHQTHLTKIFK